MSVRRVTAFTAGCALLFWQGTADASRTNSRRVADVPVAGQPGRVPPPVVVISLARQSLSVYAGTELVSRSPISSGMASHRTPTGVFSVLQRARYHESNIYSGAPMPFMQRLTWSGIALHAGQLPGYPASHGCIRLPYDFAGDLFGRLRMGARVIVSNDALEPVSFAHPRLPTPVMMPAIAQDNGRPFLTLASATPVEAPIKVAALNPREAAELEKRRAVQALGDAQREAAARLEDARVAATRVDVLNEQRLATDRQIDVYRQWRLRIERDLVRAQDDEERGQAEASLFAVDEAIAHAKIEVDRLRRAGQEAYDASFPAARRAREAEDAAERAGDVVRLANVGTEPVSIFVSRKEGKVYLRQGFLPVYDGELIIREPGEPLGTHVFTAVDVDEVAGQLKWTAVTIPDGRSPRRTAAEALERIGFESRVGYEIGKRLWAGATLIISDQGLGPETGKGTDFVVITN